MDRAGSTFVFQVINSDGVGVWKSKRRIGRVVGTTHVYSVSPTLTLKWNEKDSPAKSFNI